MNTADCRAADRPEASEAAERRPYSPPVLKLLTSQESEGKMFMYKTEYSGNSGPS